MATTVPLSRPLKEADGVWQLMTMVVASGGRWWWLLVVVADGGCGRW